MRVPVNTPMHCYYSPYKLGEQVLLRGKYAGEIVAVMFRHDHQGGFFVQYEVTYWNGRGFVTGHNVHVDHLDRISPSLEAG